MAKRLITYFLGMKMAQTKKSINVWEKLLISYDFKRVLEIGTYKGNLSLYLLLYCINSRAEFYTYDPKKLWGGSLLKNNLSFSDYYYKWDVFEHEQEIGDIIQKEGMSIVFCDGNDKSREFNVFVPYMKVGDVLGVHDWNTEYSSEEDMRESIDKYNLVEILSKECDEEGYLRFFVKENINTAEHWDAIHKSSGKFSAKMMYNLFKLIPEKSSVIDIGCGRASLIKKLKLEKECDVYGVDISQFAIDRLNCEGIDGCVVDAENLDDFEKTSDVVVISHTLEHITNDENLIKNALRIAKKFVLIGVPDGLPPSEVKEHIRAYDKDGLTKMLLKYSDKVEDFSKGDRLILKAYAKDNI